MNIVHHVSNNDATATGEPCEPMPCTKTVHHGVVDSITTYWKPTVAEAIAIFEGALVRVEVMAGHLPPLAVQVDGVPA